ncbi:hypothetical protein H6P81_013181 [Aristolochia fimbriata]|uniref:CRM domain-containing protein n=1 Tax=Aristolochia fimbriata TaxID=158543 RepID=A0AAV7EDZ1_ARIFI|nr:hypothetical protein H6P81_013181 [Aristolochia fimbriata]
MARILASMLFRDSIKRQNSMVSLLKASPSICFTWYPRLAGFCSLTSSGVYCEISYQKPEISSPNGTANISHGSLQIHAGLLSYTADEAVDPVKISEDDSAVDKIGEEKKKRKKMKGKRAVVRWLKFFRWKKKKEYKRMTAEEKILYKLRKARRKEVRLVEALKKIEPPDSSEPTHDPEILTPEEHFFFLKMGHKSKNYVPIGIRGISQGVILNMHLHWKKHQTLKVIVKTFSPEGVKEIAAELARLSGGIVLEIHEDNTIIMYRGKNYCQPPTEIMSPKIALSKRKALMKSKIRDGLRAVRAYIPRLEHELVLLPALTKTAEDKDTITLKETSQTDIISGPELSDYPFEKHNGLEDSKSVTADSSRDDSSMDDSGLSDSESLSDIFETDSDGEPERKERPLFLDAIERDPVEDNKDPEDFEEHLRQISIESKKANSAGKDIEMSEFDEVDRLFLRASSLLRKRRK